MPDTAADRAHQNRVLRETARAERLNGAAKASDIRGMPVQNYAKEKLAHVEDLALDLESGRIVQVILSTGGFAGIGDTLTAVPPGALHHDVPNKVLHLEADKPALLAAPRFDMARWAELNDAEHLSAVYRLYGEGPAFVFVHPGEGALQEQRHADGTVDKNRGSRASNTLIPVSRLGRLQRASALVGTPVNNLQDEKLGKVDDILLDLPSGRIVAVVVSSGGFLGLGDELSAIPPTALRLLSEGTVLQLDATKDMMSNAPHFKANQWPDFAQAGYTTGLYHAYRIEPYFKSDRSGTADNAPRDDRKATGSNQGSSPADVEMTSRIRRGIMDDKETSASARNVQISTLQGHVTLSGPVESAEQKRLIGNVAIGIALLANVDNQLVIR